MSLRELSFLRLNETPRTDLVPVFAEARSIPRLFHQTYSGGPLPSEMCRNIDFIRNINQGWTYRFYDERARQNFIEDHYGAEVLSLYLRLNPEYAAARSDLFRYLALYRLGGIYLDVKSAALRPFDSILRPGDGYLLSQWKNREGEDFAGWGLHPELAGIEGGEFQQWFIVAVPGHPFLRMVIAHVLSNIERYVPGIHRTGAYAVFRVTGPIAYSLAIAPLLKHSRHRFVDATDDLGFSYSIYGRNTRQEHKRILASHYAELKTSLTEVGVAKKLFFDLYRAAAGTQKFIVANLR